MITLQTESKIFMMAEAKSSNRQDANRIQQFRTTQQVISKLAMQHSFTGGQVKNQILHYEQFLFT